MASQSFLQGEACSTMWVYTGKVFDPKAAMLWPGDGEVPSAALVAIAVVVFCGIGALTPPGLLWQKEYRARAAVAAAKPTKAH